MRKHLTEQHPETAEVIVGSNVAMSQQDGRITLHAPGTGGRKVIGNYASAAEAWAALDEFDAPFEAESAIEAA